MGEALARLFSPSSPALPYLSLGKAAATGPTIRAR